MLQDSPLAELAVSLLKLGSVFCIGLVCFAFLEFSTPRPDWGPDVQMAPQHHVKVNGLDRLDKEMTPLHHATS